MAKKRRTRSRSRRSTDQKASKTPDFPIFVSGMPAGLRPPNHMLVLRASKTTKFPLLAAGEPSDSVGGNTNPAFYCRNTALDGPKTTEEVIHEIRHRRPSWIDPHWLAHMVRRSEAFQEKITPILKRNNLDSGAKLLAPLIMQAFDEQYVPAIRKKLEQNVSVLAEWLILSAAERQIAEAQQKKRGSKCPNQPSPQSTPHKPRPTRTRKRKPR